MWRILVISLRQRSLLRGVVSVGGGGGGGFSLLDETVKVAAVDFIQVAFASECAEIRPIDLIQIPLLATETKTTVAAK